MTFDHAVIAVSFKLGYISTRVYTAFWSQLCVCTQIAKLTLVLACYVWQDELLMLSPSGLCLV